MQDKKASFAGKLPGGPPTKKRKAKNQLLPGREAYSRLDSKQFKQLLGAKPSYPCYLDFNSGDFALASLDFLLGCPDVIKEIDLSNNKLVDCSTGVFEHLSKLKSLIVDHNSLLDIQFKGLSSLTTLSLANNQLNYLNDMSDLKNLVYLDLSGNKLEAGFDQIFKLKSLKVLDLGNNGITLPLSSFWRSFNGLCRLPKLQYLSFAGNPCAESINKYRLFVINEFRQIKFLDWQEITKEERNSATKLDADGEWKDKTAVLEKKGSRNRFSGVKEVEKRLQEEKEKRLSRGTASKIVVKPADPGKGAQLDELLNGLAKSDPLDELIPDDGGNEFDLAAGGADPLDDLLEYLAEGTKLGFEEPAPVPPAPQTEENVDYLALLNGIISTSENDSKKSNDKKPVTAPTPSPAPPAKPQAKEEDYLEALIDMIKTDTFEEKTQEKEVEKKPEPKPAQPQPSIPTDESIFNLLDEIMDSKQTRKSSMVDIASVEKSLAEFENSLNNFPTRREKELQLLEDEKKKLIEEERQKHEAEIKKLQEKQQAELEKQKLEIEKERRRLTEMAAKEKAERRKTQQLLDLLVEDERNREEQREREKQDKGKEDAKALLEEARRKKVSMDRRKLEKELDDASTPMARKPSVDNGSPNMPRNSASFSPFPTAGSNFKTPPPSVKQQTAALTPKPKPQPQPAAAASPSPSHAAGSPISSGGGARKSLTFGPSPVQVPSPKQDAVDELMSDLLKLNFEPPPQEIPPPVVLPPAKTWLCRYDEIQFGEKMGLGSYGTSFRGSLRGKGPVVIKKLLCQRFKDFFVDTLKDEAHRLSNLQHPVLAEFKSLCVDTDLCLVTEYVDGIPLGVYLQDPKNTVTLNWAHSVARDIAEALSYLHANGIVHRSLKPSNIIVNKEGKIKVTDFGFVMVKEEVARSGQLGLPQYSAPEVIQRMPADAKSDVFSYAMLLIELFSRVPPFEGLMPKEVISSIVERNQRPPIPICPFVFVRLIQACWNTVPQKRPTCDMVVKILNQPSDEVLKFAPGVEPRENVPHPAEHAARQVPTMQVTASSGDSRSAQVIERIVQMLQSPDIQLQLKALRAAYNFCADDANKRAIVDSPLASLLVTVCSNYDDIIREQAVLVIGLVAEGEYNANKLGEEGAMAALLGLCHGGNNDMIVTKTLKSLEKLASQSEQNIVRAGETAISVLLGLLKATHNDLVRIQLVATLVSFLPKESNQLTFYKLGGMQVLLGLLSEGQNPSLQLRVVDALALLTTNEKMEAIVLKVGVLPRLLAIFDTRSPLLQQQALANVSKFAKRAGLKEELYRNGLTPRLMRLLADGIAEEKVLSEVIHILNELLAENSIERAATVNHYGGMVPYIRILQAPNFSEELKTGCAHLVLLLLRNEDNQKDMIMKGGVPVLLEVASAPGCLEELQANILECLHALSPHENALVLMARGGAITLLAAQFLDCKNEKVQLEAVSILCLLSAMKDNKDLFPDSDAIQALVPLLESDNNEVQKQALASLANLADHENCRRIIIEECALIPILLAMSQTTDSKLMERLIWAMSYFALDVDCHEDIRNHGMNLIVDLLLLDKVAVVSLALKTLLLLLVKSEGSKAAAMAAGLAQKAAPLTSSPNRAVAAASQKVLSLIS